MEELFKNMHLQLSTEDIRKIDEWKIAHGMKSRTEAIRAMIRMATTGEITEGGKANSLLEKTISEFLKPEQKVKASNESLEEIVRKVVKEELQKILKG